ncbi:MAG: hypothetical protein NTV69_20340, partial [Caldilinea sp.]|nr:hypothetical protein [Caldilinea sp.]
MNFSFFFVLLPLLLLPAPCPVRKGGCGGATPTHAATRGSSAWLQATPPPRAPPPPPPPTVWAPARGGTVQ